MTYGNPAYPDDAMSHNMIMGVCARLAAMSGLPRWVVRSVAVLLLLTHFLFAGMVYLLLAAVLKDPSGTSLGTAARRAYAAGTTTYAPGWQDLGGRFGTLDRRLRALEAAALAQEMELRRAFREL